MPVMNDPYKILGVSEASTDKEIKAAYRKLSKKYHPDLNAGNKETESKFKEINNAYDVINNPESRKTYNEQKEYDNFMNRQQRHSSRQNPYSRRSSSRARYNTNSNGEYEDIFSSIFGRNAQQSGFAEEQTGQDVQYELKIQFKEAVLGTEKEIVLAKGNRLKVKIAAGIETGTKLRFKGQGQPGFRKDNFGDAYVKIQVLPSSVFMKKKNDLYIELPITIYEAILGAKIKVPTIRGEVSLTIPPNVDTGTKLRMKNMGYRQKTTSNRGNQFVQLQVKLPPKKDPELIEFLEKWAKDRPYNPRK